MDQLRKTFNTFVILMFASIFLQPFFTFCSVNENYDPETCKYMSDGGKYINESCGWLMEYSWIALCLMVLALACIHFAFDRKMLLRSVKYIIILTTGLIIMFSAQLYYHFMSDGRQFLCEMKTSTGCNYDCSSQLVGVSKFSYFALDVFWILILADAVIEYIREKKGYTDHAENLHMTL